MNRKAKSFSFYSIFSSSGETSVVKSLPLLFVLTQLGHVTGPQGHGTSSLHSPLSTVQAPGRGLLQGEMALPTYVALAASGPPLTEHGPPQSQQCFPSALTSMSARTRSWESTARASPPAGSNPSPLAGSSGCSSKLASLPLLDAAFRASVPRMSSFCTR